MPVKTTAAGSGVGQPAGTGISDVDDGSAVGTGMSGGSDDPDADERDLRSRAAARGRYGRNAMVQGAAAEFFKTWAVIVRARLGSPARIVLCLHDELLVHSLSVDASKTVDVVEAALHETATRWLALDPHVDVRFVADTSVVHRWSDAK